MKTIDRNLMRSVLPIPVWLFTGVTLTALAYASYTHLDQAMCMLGAPPHGCSPWVNNSELGGRRGLY